MDIDGFDEIIQMIYVAKTLYDMGRYDLATESFYDELDFDNYHQGMYELIGNICEYSTLRYYENRNFELHILSDAVMVDFYILAGEYGKLSGIPDSENDYIKNAIKEARKQFNISHCIDWILEGHIKPTRPYHSRIGIIINQDCGCYDMGVLALRIIRFHSWFEVQCEELREKIAAFEPNTQVERQAVAA